MIPISPMIRRNFKKLFEQDMSLRFFHDHHPKKLSANNQLFKNQIKI